MSRIRHLTETTPEGDRPVRDRSVSVEDSYPVGEERQRVPCRSGTDTSDTGLHVNGYGEESDPWGPLVSDR